jgi:hypothetical protein
MSLGESDQLDQENYIRKITLEALPDLINDLGTSLDFTVSDEPWTGKILAVDGDTIMINAGKEVGLEGEPVFKVFSVGEAVSSGTGRTIHLLGVNIGEIKSPRSWKSIHWPKSYNGGPFEAKQFIRLKQ